MPQLPLLTVLIRLALFFALLLPVTTAPAQQPAPGVVTDASGVIARLEDTREAVQNDANLADDDRAHILELLSRAVAEQRRADTVNAEAEALESRVEQAPARIERLRAKLNQAGGSDFEIPGDDLAATAAAKQQSLDVARAELTRREKELAALTSLGPALSEQILQLETRLRERSEDTPPASMEMLPVARDARSAYEDAVEARLQAELRKAGQQLHNYELLLQLATLERDVAAQTVSRLDAENEALIAALENRRREEARTAREVAEEAEAATVGLPDTVTALARENAALTAELESVTRNTAAVAERMRMTERRAGELQADLVSIREQVQSARNSDALGRVLRRRLHSIHEYDMPGLPVENLDSAAVHATDRRIDLAEQRRELTGLEAEIDSVMAEIAQSELENYQRDELRDRVGSLLRARRNAVEELHAAYGRYLTRITGLESARNNLTEIEEATVDFIKRERLWFRSLPPLSLTELTRLPTTLDSLPPAQSWASLGHDSFRSFTTRPVAALSGVILILGLFSLRRWSRRRLKALAGLTARVRTDAFQHTVFALGLTLAVAAAWPLTVAWLGWLVDAAPEASTFSRQVSSALMSVSQLLVIFSLARWVMHPAGLATAHLGWPDPIRHTLLRELRWLMPVSVVCVALAAFAAREGSENLRGFLGRPAMIVFSAALCVFIWRLLRGTGAIIRHLREQHPASLTTRTWWLWFPALIAVPTANIIAIAAGYEFAAAFAIELFIKTAWLALGIVILRDVMLRWFTVSERRLRFERALNYREEARRQEQERADGATEEPTVSEAVDIDVPEVNYRELGEQGRAVVRAAVLLGVVLGLWTLWNELLPALTVLNEFTLPITRSTVVEGVEQQMPVYVTDVLVSLFVLGATLFLARNLSGLLGFTLLRRIVSDAGAQYAVITLCQYTLVIVGLLYAFSSLGVQWSKLQWLVAALGVGLGFGLQEIVANFVSGIILLLERPVRVGDVVTVGDATGTVSQIRIRATTLLDFDRKELVVPNKEFVTGRLLNWTLSQDTLRIVIPVGIAYGSDPRKARELLLEAAQQNDMVMTDPAPIIVFNSFGDNALGLELRVYVATFDHYLAVQTDMHDAIYEKFADAGITIAFPQRDVHLDFHSPLDVRVHRGKNDGN